MKTFDESMAIAREIATQVNNADGRAYFVGGFVRDKLLGGDPKDLDIEIHGVTPEKLEEILAKFGEVSKAGRAFGIFKVEAIDLDVAMPRTEKLTGRGHRDFETTVDPFIGTEKAAVRRDFTINAMMEDVLTGEIIDHFGGKNDLEKGILRHVNDHSFPEDPLRVLRCAQFAARFGFTVAPETLELCRHIPLNSLSPERIEGEMKKALLRSEKPSVFFEFLKDACQLGYWFPEARDLIGVVQDPRFHSEGDVWTHTMMVLDVAATRRKLASDPYAFMLSALCHDFGKPSTTEFVNSAIHSYGHETAGIPVTEKFLRRVTNEKKTIKYVQNMVMMHMQPNVVAAQQSSVKATNHMFDKSVDPFGLIQLAVSDSLGRTAGGSSESFLLERYAIFTNMMSKPYVAGSDLIAAGLHPDESFGDILAYAHKLRLAGIEKDSALKQTLAYARKI